MKLFVQSFIHPTIHSRYNSLEFRIFSGKQYTQQLTLFFSRRNRWEENKHIQGKKKHSLITTEDTCSCWMQHKWMLNSHCVARFVFHCSLFFSQSRSSIVLLIRFFIACSIKWFHNDAILFIHQPTNQPNTTTSTSTNTTTIVRLWIECNDFRNSRLVYLWVFAGKAMLNIHDTSNMITIRLLTTTAFYARGFNKMLPE